MWIKRDFLEHFDSKSCLEAIYLKGPRQIGKTSLLMRLEPRVQSEWFFDDLMTRERAQKDPEFLLSQSKFPVLIDEAHLAPEVFYTIKKRIDEVRRERLKEGSDSLKSALFRLTGSNLHEVNTSVQETLAGRVNIFFLHGLSWNEVINHAPKTFISEYLFRGGFPELWVRPELSPVKFVNDYISTFIEKDLARSIGVEKKLEFLTVLKLLAARVGSVLNYESIGSDANVKGKTVKQWLSLLEENKILYVLEPYSSNLNQRLIKMPKVYFIDTGICARLQAHPVSETLLNSPQAGALFECMVVSEVVKTRDHFRKEWSLHFWRTKEKEEIDLIIETDSDMILVEVKLGSSSAHAINSPKTLSKVGKRITSIIVTASGNRHRISPSTECVPLNELVPFLLSALR